MRALKVILLTLFLCLCGLNIPSQIKSTGHNSTKSDLMETSIQVIFKTNQVCNIEEVKRKAIRAIKSRGWTPVDHGECGINLVVGQAPLCNVVFTEGIFKKTQQITFNEDGTVKDIGQSSKK
jgi:hypothetical protein